MLVIMAIIKAEDRPFKEFWRGGQMFEGQKSRSVHPMVG
jgi:hypothetical protein